MGSLFGSVSDALKDRSATVAARILEGTFSVELCAMERSVGSSDALR